MYYKSLNPPSGKIKYLRSLGIEKLNYSAGQEYLHGHFGITALLL
jgi:hypothetical protein